MGAQNRSPAAHRQRVQHVAIRSVTKYPKAGKGARAVVVKASPPQHKLAIGWREAESGQELKQLWRERGAAESRGDRGYDRGCTKDSLWTGGAGSKVPEGLRRKAAGGDEEENTTEDGAAGGAEANSFVSPESSEKIKPVRFKDALGRKFTFPFKMISTWEGVHGLICSAFEHVEPVGELVRDGRYDLVGPTGEIILPQCWEMLVEPDWTISMHMWPLQEPPKKSVPEYPVWVVCRCGETLEKSSLTCASRTDVDNDICGACGTRAETDLRCEQSLRSEKTTRDFGTQTIGMQPDALDVAILARFTDMGLD